MPLMKYIVHFQAVGQEEQELPLLNLSLQVSKGDILNLNNSDLIACAVISENDVVSWLSVYNFFVLGGQLVDLNRVK